MKEPIQKYFQVGTIQWMTHPPVSYPVCDSVRTICCDPYFISVSVIIDPLADHCNFIRHLLTIRNLFKIPGFYHSCSGNNHCR